MSDFTDNEDKMLVQLVREHERTTSKGTKIPWTAFSKKMKSKKRPEQLRMRIGCLKRRFGENVGNFPQWYFLQLANNKSTKRQKALREKKCAEEELCVWRKRLQDAYAAIRKDQWANDILVLGHGHMYGELIPSRLIKIFEIFKRNCDFNCNSVFVDLGCGLGKVVYMAYKSGIKISIGIYLSIYIESR